jgi:hypothetical protein
VTERVDDPPESPAVLAPDRRMQPRNRARLTGVSKKPIGRWRSPQRSSTKSRLRLARSLDHFNVPEPEKGEVLAAFAAHKGEVVEGYAGQY